MSEKRKNHCYTYFKITGDFDPDEVTRRLGIMPENQWKIGDYRRNGSRYGFANWEIGRCTDYDEIVTNQMRKTITPLLNKVEHLHQIHEDFDVAFVLEVVPTIYSGEMEPALAPNLDIIDFCHATRTEIDIELCIERDDPHEKELPIAPSGA